MHFNKQDVNQHSVVGKCCTELYKQHAVHYINALKAKLNPICHLLALLGAHHILHVSRIRIKLVILLKSIGQAQCCVTFDKNNRPPT